MTQVPSGPSVRCLIQLYDVLGVPHFQRGLVWNRENIALLLESLYLDTPCGTIILWKPIQVSGQGISLGTKPAEYLIVDGQQRVRALREALADHDASAGSEEGEGSPAGTDTEDGATGTWCLNLTRLPELRGLFDSGLTRFSLFCRVSDPRKPTSAIRHNLIPLCVFGEETLDGVRNLLQPAKGVAPDAAIERIEALGIPERVRTLADRKPFFCLVLKETAGRHRIADVVGLYNRINSAGKRVEGEEKAFATLVALHPAASEWLAKLFVRIFPEPAGPLNGPGRDELLKRQKEQAFGFRLFMRAFVQACSYHFGFSLGSNAFSFDVVNGWQFKRQVTEHPEVIKDLLDRTADAVVAVRSVLRAAHCDDLRSLPETGSLAPLFQLFIRFPGLSASADKHAMLQGIAVRLLLAEMGSQNQVLRLVKQINRAGTAAQAMRSLDEELPNGEALRRHLKSRLKGANALQDRYTLLLYWLLRRNGARDFSYGNLDEGQQLELKPGKEMALAEEAQAERQHIAPYSRLQPVYRIESRGRVSRHSANNIGNLTWISSALNSYETGLGKKLIDTSLESAENREAHFLSDEAGVADAYQLVQKALVRFASRPTEQRRGVAVTAFERFCKRRRRVLAEGFVAWVEDLSLQRTFRERIEPAPLLERSLEDRIREQGYGDELEDELVALVQEPRLKVSWKRDAKDLACRLRTRKDLKGMSLSFEPGGVTARGKMASSLFQALTGIAAASGIAPSGPKDDLLIPAAAASASVFATWRTAIESGVVVT